MRAMSVLGSAKSNRHRKTHRVEPDGTGRKFMHLTRGGLDAERRPEVSRGHSSDEARENGRSEGPKNPRRQSTDGPTGEKPRETHRERQLRQRPGAAEKDRPVDPCPVRTARRQVSFG